MKNIFINVCKSQNIVDPGLLQSILELAVQIAREGREGRRIGTIFTVGDEEKVLELSRTLILDPLAGHPAKIKHIYNSDMRETVKELAQLDGGFVISTDGIVLSGARFFDAGTKDVKIPLGLGTRHLAAAGLSKATNALSIVVSESSLVRVFEAGNIIAEIYPELWLFRLQQSQIQSPRVEHQDEQQMTVISREKEKG
ncbi:MAG: DNA integrity scanning protein DisA nucleotide-binding domain protein [Spirochaetia bacterium]